MIRKRKTMPRRSSATSPRNVLIRTDSKDHDEEDIPFPRFLVGMPPWYVRAFLYGMMLLCFCMIFFMEAPDTQRQQQEQPAKVNQQKSIYDQSIIDYNCKKSKTDPSFAYCGIQPLEQMEKDETIQAIMSSILELKKKAVDYGKGEIGFVDIGVKDGGYLALFAAKNGMRVYVAEGGEVERQQLKIGMHANNVFDAINIIDTDQKFDRVEIIDRLAETIKAIDLKDAMMRIELGEYECNTFERADHFLSTVKISKIFTPWRVSEEDKHHSCVITMLSKLISHKFKPMQLEGAMLDAHGWKSWFDGYIMWNRS